MNRVIAFLQARMSSSRLPGKVLRPLCGKPMLLWQIERLQKSSYLDDLVVLTSADSSDDQLVEFCEQHKINVFRGSLDDVLLRFYQASKKYRAENYVRVTGDCPLLDYRIVDKVVKAHLDEGEDYTSNIAPPTFPDGMDIEVFKGKVLEEMNELATSRPDREHVTLYVRNNDKYTKYNVRSEDDYSFIRITVDEEKDVAVIEEILESTSGDVSLEEIIQLYRRTPEVFCHNTGIKRNEGLEKSMNEERSQIFSERYKKSMEFLDRALKSIPLGSQTFSKSKTQFPYGVSPYFISKAKGSKTWDVDGNEYVDFLSALLCISLGHADPDVIKAVSEQLERGTIFSLPSTLEFEVAEALKEIIPCADSVRFGKNGSDATSAAIRLARAYTKREKVAVCGYHGWQDWYIGSTTKNLGVPKLVSDLTKKFEYNNPDSLRQIFEENKGEVAAVIMEPMNTTYPKTGFLETVKDLAHEHGALFIFDEMITGFRFSLGGASELFGVTPDLACFGKGLANGYPLSAIVGRADVMALMEDIFFSGTFGGETLSLAAASATLEKLKREKVIDRIHEKGLKVMSDLKTLVEKNGLSESFDVVGHPSWSFFIPTANAKFDPFEIKTLLIQEMLASGVLGVGTHNLTYAHTDEDILKLMDGYQKFFDTYKAALNEGRIEPFLFGEKLVPLFKVR